MDRTANGSTIITKNQRLVTILISFIRYTKSHRFNDTARIQERQAKRIMWLFITNYRLHCYSMLQKYTSKRIIKRQSSLLKSSRTMTTDIPARKIDMFRAQNSLKFVELNIIDYRYLIVLISDHLQLLNNNFVFLGLSSQYIMNIQPTKDYQSSNIIQKR